MMTMKEMKRLFFIVTVLLSAMLICSCSKSDDGTPSEEANYYVKYEAVNKTKHIGDVSEIIVNTDQGSKSYISDRTFSETFGPVKKGFTAKIVCNDRTGVNSVSVSIYVSVGKEPFALKATNTASQTVSASYTIDF